MLGGVASALGCPGRPPGDAVLLHSPTYIGFTHTLEDNGYRIVHSPLVQDENGTGGWTHADMDRNAKKPHPCGDFFCSPPTLRPRVERWNRKAMDVYRENGVTVISTRSGPISSWRPQAHPHPVRQCEDARQRTIALYALSKTSTWLPIGSYHIIYNKNAADRAAARSEKHIITR